MIQLGMQIMRQGYENHKFIEFSDHRTGVIRQCAVILSNHYIQKNLSAKQWVKDKQQYKHHYRDLAGRELISDTISYSLFSSHLREHLFFSPQAFALPDIFCYWLDHGTDIRMNWISHKGDEALGVASGDLQNYYGKQFPLNPMIRREGVIYSCLQPILINRIIKERSRLIAESHLALTDDWIMDLRNLISETISLVDIALTQLYIKAEYDPLPNWTFDKESLGERAGQRMDNKIKWVRKITGRPFDIESEKPKLDILREIRNHIMHFDPPCFVMTIEEAVTWLNHIIDVGQILIKIRQSAGVVISQDLINFILQREAKFTPIVSGYRLPVDNENKGTDYASSAWTKQNRLSSR